VDLPRLLTKIYEFDTRPRHQQVVVCRLAAVTTVVEPVGAHIGRKLDFDLARFQVAAGENTGVTSIGCGAGPDESVGDQQVFR